MRCEDCKYTDICLDKKEQPELVGCASKDYPLRTDKPKEK